MDEQLKTTVDFIARAFALENGGSRKGSFRLFGGLACRIHSSSGDAFGRDDRRFDVDIFTRHFTLDMRILIQKAGAIWLETSLLKTGAFNRFKILDNGVIIDFYSGVFEFNQSIPISGRLTVDQPTFPLAELLLSKLQIHELSDKHKSDIVLLLADHELGFSDTEEINLAVIASYCGSDWCLWYECLRNISLVQGFLVREEGWTEGIKGIVQIKLANLEAALMSCRKGFRWRLRAPFGTRLRYYNEVEEIPYGDANA